MKRLEIVILPVGSITPYENNTRKHAEKDVAQIAESIRLDGFNDPIGVWGDRNIIVEGHGRLLAAKRLGLKEVPCIRLDHLTDTERKEYAIRHNRTAEFSTWDFDMLAAEMAKLEADGYSFDGLEFHADADTELSQSDGEGATEYGEDLFGDDAFTCECPECGFRFNE